VSVIVTSVTNFLMYDPSTLLCIPSDGLFFLLCCAMCPFYECIRSSCCVVLCVLFTNVFVLPVVLCYVSSLRMYSFFLLCCAMCLLYECIHSSCCVVLCVLFTNVFVLPVVLCYVSFYKCIRSSCCVVLCVFFANAFVKKTHTTTLQEEQPTT
jgi:hypothetical protein